MEYTKKVFAFLLYSILCVWGILTTRVKYELLSYFNNIFSTLSVFVCNDCIEYFNVCWHGQFEIQFVSLRNK